MMAYVIILAVAIWGAHHQPQPEPVRLDPYVCYSGACA